LYDSKEDKETNKLVVQLGKKKIMRESENEFEIRVCRLID